MKLTVQAWDASVDYLRLTQRSEGDHNEAMRVYLREAVRLVDAGASDQSNRKDWSWRGYLGHTWGNISYGARYDGAILQVSGWAAHLAAEGAKRYTGVPRIDIAVTFWTDIHAPEVAHDAATLAAYGVAKSRGKRPTVRLVSTYGDGDTLYLGSRTSQRMTRIYDKWLQTKKSAEYRYAWRVETEYKDELAVKVLALIQQNGLERESLLPLVAGEVDRYGIDIGALAGLKDCPRVVVPTVKATTDSRAVWLETQVRPAVKAMMRDGWQPQQIAELLGIWEEVGYNERKRFSGEGEDW